MKRFVNYKYEVTDDGVRITEYVSETDEDVVEIPVEIEGRPVTEIAAGAFYLTPVADIHLPDGLQDIKNPWELGAVHFHASPRNPHFFSDGFGLYRTHDGGRELIVSFTDDTREEYRPVEGTTVIGENSLSGNNHLKKVVLPDSVRIIGETAFEACENLSEVVLNEGLKEIGADAFSHCIRLTELHLPSTLEKIGERALSDTFGWSDSHLGIERITVEPGNLHFAADETGLFEIGSEEERHLIKYLGKGEEYRVPGDVNSILPGAFRRAKFRRIFIPALVKSIGKEAFRECRHLSEIFFESTGARVYIPMRPAYRKDEVTALICGEADDDGRFLDREGYDAIFATWLDPCDKCGMACFRLADPVPPDASMAAAYRGYIENNFEAIIKDIVKHRDMETLKTLADLGFMEGERLDFATALFSSTGQTAMTSFVLSLGSNAAFDFEL